MFRLYANILLSGIFLIFFIPKISLASLTVAISAHQHCDYLGYGKELEVREYRLRDLQQIGVRNNDLSSISLPPGYKVTLYDSDNLQGTSLAFTESIRCLSEYDFDNITSSLKVEEIAEIRECEVEIKSATPLWDWLNPFTWGLNGFEFDTDNYTLDAGDDRAFITNHVTRVENKGNADLFINYNDFWGIKTKFVRPNSAASLDSKTVTGLLCR